jgi:hypothetical protein
MKASKDLQFQLNQLKISGTMHLNHILKEELNQIHQAEFGSAYQPAMCFMCVVSGAQGKQVGSKPVTDSKGRQDSTASESGSEDGN